MVSTLTTLTDRYTAARSGLSSIGQEHILHFYDRLDEAGKVRLLGQIEQVRRATIFDLAADGDDVGFQRVHLFAGIGEEAHGAAPSAMAALAA